MGSIRQRYSRMGSGAWHCHWEARCFLSFILPLDILMTAPGTTEWTATIPGITWWHITEKKKAGGGDV